MNPTVATAGVSVIATAVPAAHPKFDKFMSILAALEPVILAGASPFIKNSTTGNVVAAESPIAQTLLAALSNL